MFSPRFNIEVDTVPDGFQMEVIDIQNNTNLKYVFFSANIENFYKSYVSAEKFQLLTKNAKQMTSLFGSTYACERLFSTMKLIKNDHRS